MVFLAHHPPHSNSCFEFPSFRDWAEKEQQQAATQIPTQYAPQETQYAPEPEDDLTEKLDRLASLHHRGQLTDEEYAAAKAKVLEL